MILSGEARRAGRVGTDGESVSILKWARIEKSPAVIGQPPVVIADPPHDR